MKLTRKDIELMAPVGSFESLSAAIQGGADSVYFGIEKLNMRSRSSSNFTIQDLEKITALASKNNLKTYMALNTIIYDSELDFMREIIDAAKDAGVSAVIASDQSVLSYAKSKNVVVHLSTQLNITNFETLKFYANYADVVVLARELNLDQVKRIYQKINEHQLKGPSGKLMRIELFVHGALCMAVSGKCYLSLHEFNRSANRGECFQTCRRGYFVTDRETGYELEIDNQYIMSPKDLCTIRFLNKIVDAGVRILKIEGRARPPEYVKTVTKCYNEAIYAIANETYGPEAIENWVEELKTVFNRGFWDGYYLGQKLGEWNEVYGSRATRKKKYIGKGLNYFSNLKVAEFLIEAGTLKVGDDVLIIGPTTGVIETKVNELRIDLNISEKAIKGQKCSIPVDSIVRRSDKLYIWTEVK